MLCFFFFFFSSRRRHTRLQGDWSSDVCSSDLINWRACGGRTSAPDRPPGRGSGRRAEIGRGAWRGKGEISGGAASFKKKKKKKKTRKRREKLGTLSQTQQNVRVHKSSCLFQAEDGIRDYKVTGVQTFALLFQAEDGIRDYKVTGVQTCALPIWMPKNREKNNQADSEMEAEGLPIFRANVAGIDLGSKKHWVCAPKLGGQGREVESFGATTPELERMAAWLKERNVESVAMESTGVYWVAPQEVLERHALEVVLVDTRQLARVPGRKKKTDPVDCQWIQRLHSCGLLTGAFRPVEQVCMLRTLVRDKAILVAEMGDWLRRMQKSLDQMNVRVHCAVSDIDGATGMAIVRAIVGGERDARQLAKLRDPHCHQSEEAIAEQLSGHWRADHLFTLEQTLKMYEAIQERIAAYEREIMRKLAEMEREECRGKEAPKLNNPNKAKAIKKRGEE